MKKLFSSLCGLLLAVAAAAMLAACASAEKSDIQAVASAFKEVGFNQQISISYQNRIKNAKNDEEMKVVIGEMLDLIAKVPPKLDALELRSDSVKAIRSKFSAGYAQMNTVGRRLLAATNEAEAQAAQAQMLQARQQIAAAFREFAAVAEKEGLSIDKSALPE